MSSKLLALPAELKIKIVTLLAPGIDRPSDFPTHCRTLANDIESIVHSLPNVESFSRVCRETRALCGQLFHHAVTLGVDNDRDGVANTSRLTLASFIEVRRTWFLSLHYDSSGGNSSEESVPDSMSVERVSSLAQSPDNSITMTFKHFPSITTLDLLHFPLSLVLLRALQHLPSLKTLSIRFPDDTVESIASPDELQSLRSMPQVAIISIDSVRDGACLAVGSVLRLFESSLTMVSIIGVDYGSGESCFIDDLFLEDEHAQGFAKLQHLCIDFLEFDPQSLRQLTSSIKTLESILVDSRGTIGFLPLFYIVELIRITSGEIVDTTALENYESQQEHWSLNDLHVVDRLEAAGIWTARLERFFYSFTVVQTETGPVKALESLELIFAYANENSHLINTGLIFCHLVQVIRARAAMFQRLRTLTVAISKYFKSRETEAQIQAAILVLVRRCLPSVRMIRVQWGALRDVIWRRHDAPDMMDVDIHETT